MQVDVDQTALIRFLKAKSPTYFGKFLEVREEVKGWLAYTVQTFPHYTRHTIEHSDQIVLQLSYLLFRDGKSRPSVSKLTATDAYILAISALLHDAGMVASDEEKAQILAEPAFQDWIKQSRAAEWTALAALRSSGGLPDQSVRDFLADVELRRLVGEFVRRQHHVRAYRLLDQHDLLFGRVSFGDHQLKEAIAVVCLGHGLSKSELDDSNRYPLVRQIRGEIVHLRLLAILFRLGDLLDMSTDRACPLLMNAANPLPQDSQAHWTQYKRISHFHVSPTEIGITAECETPEEHRVLQDWCQWIADEVRHAPSLLASPSVDVVWTPPNAKLDGPNPTISIKPSTHAKYRAVDWRFELEEAAVFQRLIKDVYDEPLSFVRELIQNSLDATRCKIYDDLAAAKLPMPEKPTDIPEHLRKNYPIHVTLHELPGDNDSHHGQVLEVADFGIGMNEEVVKRFFLQVGRSYYSSESFRARYRFSPISMFGVGFLSVFAASNHVEVSTLRIEDTGTSRGLHIRLHGPRNYVIIENDERSSSGTSIRIHLHGDAKLSSAKLHRFIRAVCAKSEFPITIRSARAIETVQREHPDDWGFEIPDFASIGAHYSLREFPIENRSIEGELYVIAHVSKDGVERWDTKHQFSNYQHTYPEFRNRGLPNSAVFFQGVLVEEEPNYSTDAFAYRIDARDARLQPTLSRGSFVSARYGMESEITTLLKPHWHKVISEHL